MAEFSSSRNDNADAQLPPDLAPQLAEATAQARLALEAALYPARAARAGMVARIWELLGVFALGLVAAGFALFACLIFVNLLFHYNVGL